MALMCGAEPSLNFRFMRRDLRSFCTWICISLESRIVDSICFGSECDDRSWNSLQNPLLEEPEAYQILLKDYLKQGMSFHAPDRKQFFLIQKILGLQRF